MTEHSYRGKVKGHSLCQSTRVVDNTPWDLGLTYQSLLLYLQETMKYIKIVT